MEHTVWDRLGPAGWPPAAVRHISQPTRTLPLIQRCSEMCLCMFCKKYGIPPRSPHTHTHTQQRICKSCCITVVELRERLSHQLWWDSKPQRAYGLHPYKINKWSRKVWPSSRRSLPPQQVTDHDAKRPKGSRSAPEKGAFEDLGGKKKKKHTSARGCFCF